jgi:hypothetical protein
MTLRFAYVIDANASGAKRETAAAAQATDRLKASVTGAAGASRQAEAATRQLAATQGRAVAAARDLDRAMDAAAGQTGNLAAQFNDIGVQLASGSSPFLVAIQQGTQITQVLGNAGAGGAVRALGGAFLSLLNPVSLATIAVISLGGAVVQWMTAGRQETLSFADAVGELESAVGRVRDVQSNYSTEGIERLIAKYGELNAEVLLLIERQKQIAFNEASEAARGAVAALSAEFDSLVTMRDRAIQDFLGLDFVTVFDQFGAGFDVINPKVYEFEEALRRVNEAASAREKADAIAELLTLIDGTAAATGELYAELVRAEDQLRQLAASAPDASWMNAAISGVNALIGRVGSAIQATLRLRSQAAAAAAASVDPTGNLAAQYQLYGQGRVAGERLARESGALFGGTRVIPLPRGGGGGGGGGGGAAARAEADAVERLVERLRGEIDLLRESDPVKKEMLRYREQLATATEAERAKVEELIAARQKEEQQVRQMRELSDFLNQTTASAIDDLIVKGESLEKVLKNIISALARAAIQAAIFGSGPLGGLFGGKPLFDFGGRFAGGGLIRGPGSDTSDNIVALTSPGEYVVNAAATRRNLALLEAINSGRTVPRFARGGLVGAAPRAQAGGPVQLTVVVNGARGDAEIRAMAREGAVEALREYDRAVLPQSVKRISGDQRRIG